MYWHKQLSLIPNQKIKYLLISEAPPWTESGNINYIYNPHTEPSVFIRAISKAFFNDLIYKEVGIEQTLKRLAKLGFLLCDSIPFALNYSENNKRSSKKYGKLIQQSIQSYFMDKLKYSNISFSKDLKIAFSVHRNGLFIINALKSKLMINENTFSINRDLIAVNKAWYPYDKKLKQIYQLT